VIAKRSDLEGVAGWGGTEVMTGNGEKKAGKYGKTAASGGLFGTLEEGLFGSGGGGPALEGCDFALQPKKKGAAGTLPQCKKTMCGLPPADNIFDSSIAT